MGILLNLARKYREQKNSIYNCLRFVPDAQYLKLMFQLRMHRRLDLENPKTFNEKLQWLKLNYRSSRFTDMVDKYLAKDYAASVIGDEYIIKTYGVWNSFDEIDFDKLPQQFVLKCTHDSGGLVICKDKSKLDIASAKKKIERSLKCNFYYVGREWPYKNVKPRIIAEELLVDNNNEEINDYKFYCFGGKAKLLYLSKGLQNHSTARINFVTLDWKPAPYRRSDYKEFEELPKKPEKLAEMIKLSEKLSEGLPFLRVDFYEINNKVYFGELTFFPGSGFTPFLSYEMDLELGNMLQINSRK